MTTRGTIFLILLAAALFIVAAKLRPNPGPDTTPSPVPVISIK